MRALPTMALAVFAGFLPGAARAQNVNLAAAQRAYEDLEFELAITAARRALDQRLTRDERVVAYELLGFSYASLDSTPRAVEAFREMIFLDPDREPDPVRVSPRITSLYASALGQVLVVRKVRVDSASFIAGSGTFPIRFEVPRAARIRARAVAGDFVQTVDSFTVAGASTVQWNALTDGGTPLDPGRYQFIVEAEAGSDRYDAQVVVDVRHGTVDTLPHFTSLPGYELQDEFEQPARNWRPLGLATLYTALASGATLALENANLASPPRREVGSVSLAVMVTGFVMSLKKPDPRPVPASILYNQLYREELARRNAIRTEENADIRRQVMLTVVPVRSNEP